MTYNNPRTMPVHWKALRIPRRSRNPSRYTTTMNAGKPLPLSTPLSMILKRYTNDPLVTLKKIRSLLPRVKINNKNPKDLRAPVAMTDILDIDGRRYMFMLVKLGKTITYRLQQNFTPQHCIRRVIHCRDQSSLLESMTGFRLQCKESVIPGSVLVAGKVHTPLDGSIRSLIKLTGKHKYQCYQVVSAQLVDSQVVLGLVRDGQPQTITVSWQDMERRRYLTLV